MTAPTTLGCSYDFGIGGAGVKSRGIRPEHRGHPQGGVARKRSRVHDNGVLLNCGRQNGHSHDGISDSASYLPLEGTILEELLRRAYESRADYQPLYHLMIDSKVGDDLVVQLILDEIAAINQQRTAV
jgi:hypothetical protein